ncbi:MAG: cobalamin-dependent protein [Candidatus Helarchaeota archaeon]
MNKNTYLRFIMAIPGFNQDDLNAKVVSMALRDSGLEIIYLGTDNTPDQIINAAIQEDVNAIYLSVTDKTNLKLIEETIEIAKNRNFFDSPKKFIFAGGINLTTDEIKLLKEKGLAEIFALNKKTHEIVNKIINLFENN